MNAQTATLQKQTAVFALTRETALYGLITLVALGLRLPALGAAPLDEGEARMALAAWRWLSAGQAPDPALISSPLVFAGMVLSFALAGAGNAAARFLPALGGSLLALLPARFRDTFGRLPMLVAAGLLALSPGLIAASRRATGANLAILCMLLALDALRRYRGGEKTSALVASGVWLGLALLADFGAMLVGLALLAGAGAAQAIRDDRQSIRQITGAALRAVNWPVFIGALAGAIFLVSSLLGAYPRGLGAAANLLATLAQGVVRRPPDGPLVGALLPLYEPLILVFGLAGLARNLDAPQPAARFVSGWALAATLFSFIYPGGLPAQLSFAVAPLAVVAGLALAEVFNRPFEDSVWPTWVLGAILVAGTAICYTLLAFFVVYPNPLVIPGLEYTLPTIASVLLPITMLVLITLITCSVWASIWDPAHVWRGLAVGGAAVGILIALSNGFGLAYVRASDAREPWNLSPSQPALNLLGKTIREVSEIATGLDDEATITVQGDPDGAIAWALRDFPNTTFVDQASPEVTSDVVIAPAEDALSPGERYVGQDFAVRQTWGPRSLDLQRWVRWWLFREVSTLDGETARVVLWVREDIYTLLNN